MSLLNNVLRDLQGRGAFGLPPLTGLEPVTDLPSQHRKRALLLPALAALSIASALVLWRPAPDGQLLPSFARNATDATAAPQTSSQINAGASPQALPDPAVTSHDAGDQFIVDRSSDSGPPPRDGYIVDTAADSPPVSPVADAARTSQEIPGAAMAAPAEQSVPVAASLPVAAPSPQAKSPAAAGASAKTTILRHDKGDDAMSGTVSMGLAALRGNDLKTAERFFREALATDSGDVDTWSYLYGVLVRARQPEAAEQALQRGLIAAKEPAALAKLYARMLLDRRETDAAISILKIHRPAPASDADYDAFLAALLQQQGQYAEAGEIYQNLLTVDPGSGSAWIGLAMSHDSLGNRADAQTAFERALSTGSLKTPLARYARRRIEELMAYD